MSFPGLESRGFDGDDALYDSVEESETLTHTQQDHGEVEENTPEGGDVPGLEDAEVGRYELGGESVHLVARLVAGVQCRGNDPHSSEVGHVVIV